MKKQNLVITFVLTFVLMCAATACGNTGADQVSENAVEDAKENAPRDVATEFLTHFYTTDENGRYTDFIATEATTEEDLEKVVETYYSGIAPFVTEELLEELQANRTLSKQDEKDMKQNIVCTVPEVKLAEKDGGEGDAFEFEVVRNEYDIRTGEISCIETEDGYLVDYFYEKQ